MCTMLNNLDNEDLLDVNGINFCIFILLQCASNICGNQSINNLDWWSIIIILKLI